MYLLCERSFFFLNDCMHFQIFLKKKRTKGELGHVTVLHLEHGINLNLRQSGRGPNCKERKNRELQIIYIYNCCLL